MTIFYAVPISIVAAILLSSIALYFRFRSPFRGIEIIRNGPWFTNLAVGGAKMGLKLRAIIAVNGLWALKSTETVYFTATTDSDGNTLRYDQRYRIEGVDLAARWWAITVYRDHQFIPNEQYRYSYSQTNLQRNKDGSWSIRLATEPQDGNWIPLGDTDGLLTVNLRLYNPAPSVYEKTKAIPLPRIIKED